MNDWKNAKSILLSRCGIVLFALLLAALDLGGYWAVRWFVVLRSIRWQAGVGMTVTLYICSVFGWIFLWKMWRLLGNLQQGRVFEEENVALLQAVSVCCAGAGLVCLLSCVFYLPFLFAAVAACFMALIVRIVRNVFQHAVAMKDELDLTI